MFEATAQLRNALLGLVVSTMGVGIVISRFIPRAETGREADPIGFAGPEGTFRRAAAEPDAGS